MHCKPRMPYACHHEETRGRLFAEEERPYRTAFQRDRDRIIHSSAFRRLKYKTQVFVYHEGDHYRTRLTHSLEVAQIARSIARVLGLDEDLAETVALAHDLGHPPFGHAGERVLQDRMKDYGGFDHNAQSLKIVTELEKHYADFDGLNLTWETLEGLVKHNGPVTGPSLPPEIKAYNARYDLELGSYASLEAQIAALSDDIAYNCHDLDDGLRAGLFSLDDIRQLPLVGAQLQAIETKYPGLEKPRVIAELVRHLINAMLMDLVAETEKNLEAFAPDSYAAVRGAGKPLVSFSDEMIDVDKSLKEFLFTNMYRHYKVNRMMNKAQRIVKELFDLFMEDIRLLPHEWRLSLESLSGDAEKARIVCDYLAGMTDKFAMNEYERLFDPKVQT